MKEKGAYIRPIRLDNTELEGLLPSVAYLDFSDYTEEQIVGLILRSSMLPVTHDRHQRRHRGPSTSRCRRSKRPLPSARRNVFARKAFDTVRDYFEQGLKQLEQHDPDVQTEFEPVHRSKFLCHVYAKGEPLNRCKIWLGGWTYQGSQDHICYYEARNASRDQDNSTSDLFSVETDGHQLGLHATSGIAFPGGWATGNEEQLLSAERAAEMLWERFIKRLSAD